MICGEPGTYNHCDSIVYDEMPIWRWSELADTNRYCLKSPGHSGMHSDGQHHWGLMQNLTTAEKLEAFGIDDDT